MYKWFEVRKILRDPNRGRDELIKKGFKQFIQHLTKKHNVPETEIELGPIKKGIERDSYRRKGFDTIHYYAHCVVWRQGKSIGRILAIWHSPWQIKELEKANVVGFVCRLCPESDDYFFPRT